MPEEINRVVTDRVSDLLLAPSSDAVDHLRAEGYRPDQIRLVGNVMVDTLLANLDRARERPVLAELGLEPGSYAVVTLHRPANVDDERVLAGILGALDDLSRDLPVVLPAHPRSRATIERLGVSDGVRVVPPAGYLDFVALESQAALVLTDSGGIQEETTVLGVPCLTLRDNTERPITVTEGTNRLVGRDPERISRVARQVIEQGVPMRRPELWDGSAGVRCAAAVVEALERPDPRRPTDV
jgi:UDP-N-acetylglucosamine 2-epimerase (non-hydrolysing)